MNKIVAQSEPVSRQAELRVKRTVLLIEACPDKMFLTHLIGPALRST